MGTEADGCAADVRHVAEVEAAFAKCTEGFGAIDVLISGAAGNFWALAKNISSNGFRSVLRMIAHGHLPRDEQPIHMTKPGGSIINHFAGQSLRADWAKYMPTPPKRRRPDHSHARDGVGFRGYRVNSVIRLDW